MKQNGQMKNSGGASDRLIGVFLRRHGIIAQEATPADWRSAELDTRKLLDIATGRACDIESVAAAGSENRPMGHLAVAGESAVNEVLSAALLEHSR